MKSSEGHIVGTAARIPHRMQGEIGAFRQRQRDQTAAASRRLTFRLMFGLDSDAVEKLTPDALQGLVRRMALRLERERLKGTRGHWSYDLNRHIALKTTLDYVRQRIVS